MDVSTFEKETMMLIFTDALGWLLWIPYPHLKDQVASWQINLEPELSDAVARAFQSAQNKKRYYLDDKWRSATRIQRAWRKHQACATSSSPNREYGFVQILGAFRNRKDSLSIP